MSDAASVPGATCAHSSTWINLERQGFRLNQRVFLVEYCMQCDKEVGRKKATRGTLTAQSGRHD